MQCAICKGDVEHIGGCYLHCLSCGSVLLRKKKKKKMKDWIFRNKVGLIASLSYMKKLISLRR